MSFDALSFVSDAEWERQVAPMKILDEVSIGPIMALHKAKSDSANSKFSKAAKAAYSDERARISSTGAHWVPAVSVATEDMEVLGAKLIRKTNKLPFLLKGQYRTYVHDAITGALSSGRTFNSKRSVVDYIKSLREYDFVSDAVELYNLAECDSLECSACVVLSAVYY